MTYDSRGYVKSHNHYDDSQSKSHEMMSNFHFRGHLRDLGLTSATANEMLRIVEVSKWRVLSFNKV